MKPFTDLLPCLFDHMHRSAPDLPVAHTIRVLALCRDDNSTFWLTSGEMSQIIIIIIIIIYLYNLLQTHSPYTYKKNIIIDYLCTI